MGVSARGPAHTDDNVNERAGQMAALRYDDQDPRWRRVFCRVCRKAFEYMCDVHNIVVFTCDECKAKKSK